jgi:hypothetical protein
MTLPGQGGALRGSGGRIVITGALTQRCDYGGHVWAFMQYVMGYLRLGWDVLFIDQLDAAMCLDERGNVCPPEKSMRAKRFARLMGRLGLLERAALLVEGRTVVGVAKPGLVERTREATFVLNVMGYLDDEEVLSAASRRVFLDIDPGFGQMWHALHLADIFSGHDVFVTVGENIGGFDCEIPTCGLEWLTTLPPVVLDLWPACAEGRDVFTTVGAWRGPNGPVDYRGRTYGLRVHEFRSLADLPRKTGRPFEAALDIDPADDRDRQMLRSGGWSLVDPRVVAGGPDRYRRYIQSSMGELMVAKNMYVQTRGGWFSDRSASYLASGKPVVAQDTGWTNNYPDSEGLLSFKTPEEAATAVHEVHGNYRRHAKAARELAETMFDSDRVLERLAAAVTSEGLQKAAK